MKVLIKFYRFTNIYDLKFLNNETTVLWFFFFFWKFARKSILLLKFCQMKKIFKIKFCWILLWVILMEMNVSQEGCFQIMGSWICYFIFPISHLLCFSRDFCQKLYEKTIFFKIKFQKFISRCSILQKIRMSNFVILKWQTIEYKIKNWHLSFLGVVFSEIKNADILNFL